MEATTVNTHRCRVCHRGYKRPEHLKRHLASHANARVHSCVSCGATFSRSDALKRHWRTCNERNVNVTKQPRRRACDRCIQIKKACNFQFPCQTCRDKDISCSYAISGVTTSSNDTNVCFHGEFEVLFGQQETFVPSDSFGDLSWVSVGSDLLNLASTSWNDYLSLLPAHTGQHDENEKASLPFLDNFTKRTGLIQSFDCGSHLMRKMVYEHIERKFNTDTSLTSQGTEQSWSLKCAQIVELIREVATIKPRNSAVDIAWSEATRSSCQTFFAPSNIRKYSELYWSLWHPNVNILHRPTFDLLPAKPALVAAMAIMGALVSPDESDNNKARLWLNAVEEVVFIDDDFCEDIGDDLPNQFPASSRIQAVQAAYIVCLYQNWEGSDASKRRIRRHRFNALVSVTRDIGIHNATHLQPTAVNQFDWHSFALREQLIRVFLWTFLLDTAFVIFNNLPPRMVIKEMQMVLASCEAAFQAESSQQCLELLQSDTSNDDRNLQPNSFQLLVCQVAEILCMEELSNTMLHRLADLGPLNMFVIASSLHCMLFQYQNSFNSESQLAPLRNASENWKAVWTEYMATRAHSVNHAPLGQDTLMPDNMWKRIGFMRYASEYWLLASLLLDRICVREQRLDDLGEQEATAALSDHGSDQTLHPLLHRYDQTSMQQVNDLIAEFQRATIS